MHPIASYQERRFDGHRDFVLYSDHLAVKGKQMLGDEFETSIALSTLTPFASRLRTRDRGFWQGIVMTIVAAGLLQSGTLAITSYWGGLSAVMVIAGILLSLATARKIEWVQITSHAGVVTVNIARCGPDKAKFESFVAFFLKQIEASSKQAAQKERL